MNAFQAAERIVGTGRVFITHGRTCYQPELRAIYLSSGIVFSQKPGDIMEALHECGHVWQHEERPFLFALRNFGPVRLWLERDAWRRVKVYARALGVDLQGCDVPAPNGYSGARVFVR